MKLLQHRPLFLHSCAFVAVCLFVSCKRDIPIPPTDELRNITFKLSGFEAEISPLSDAQSTARLALGVPKRGMQALRNIEPGLEPQYLYYWSFNEETLEPHIAVDEVGAGIAFVGKNTEPDFVGGFGLAPVEAGRALSITGAKSLEISLPMQEIESLTAFDFDISSSGTGPKDFSLSYSVDNGNTYEVLSATNPFGTSTRDRYSFDISSFPQFIGIGMLKLKFEFFAGDRGEGSDYNENTGTLKLDNIRVSGVYNTEVEPGDPTIPSTLHYYIFSAADGSVIQQQSTAMDVLGEDGTLHVKLAEGRYDVLFLAYRSDKGILFPEGLTNANAYYFGQHFDDHRAVTYSVLLEDVEVGGSDAVETATLTRCYSRVEFDFTDLSTDLQAVKKIVVTRGHDNYLYTPFGAPANLPMSDAQSITFSGFDRPADYQIALNQFLGLLDGTKHVSYELTAYGETDVVLNTVTISEDMGNNVRLRLSGRLLGNSGTINGFAVALDTDWGEVLDREF